MELNELRNFIDTAVTHNGIFHCDEVVALSVLHIAGVKFKNIIRTRNIEPFRGKSNVLIFDVGGEYNPDALIFDHHQNDERLVRNGTIRGLSSVKYSSSGLIWKDFGHDICEHFIRSYTNITEPEEISTADERLWQTADSEIFTDIDIRDNGQDTPGNGLRAINLAVLVSAMNPEDASLSDKLFRRTVGAVSTLLRGWFISACKSIENENTVRRDFAKAAEAGTPYAFLSSSGAWKRLVQLDDNLWHLTRNISAVYFKKENGFGISAMPQDRISRTATRINLFNAGFVSDKVVFVHPNGFFAVVKDEETAKSFIRWAAELADYI